MARATKCDRCGKFFEHYFGDTNGVARLTYSVKKDRYYVQGNEYDLCPDCVKSWEDWLKRGTSNEYEK